MAACNIPGLFGGNEDPHVLTVETPVITPDLSEFSTVQSVSISTATVGASIYYTIDGTEPSSSAGTPYESEFIPPLGSTVKAIAIKGGYRDSLVAVARYNDPNWSLKLIGGSPGILAESYAVTADSHGAVYAVGIFATPDTANEGFVDFNPNTGVDARKDGGIFVTKLKADGTYAWTRRLANGYGLALATDSNGNLYITGQFTGSSDFDPVNHDSHTASGYYDIFVTKILADGSYGWTRTIGGASTNMYDDWSRSIAVDGSNNVYLTGSFSGEVDFDFSTGTDILSSVIDAEDPFGHKSAFLTKINADGTYGWSVAMGCTSSEDYGNPFGGAEGHSIALDDLGNAFVAGEFSGIIDFDPSESQDIHTSYVGLDIFVTRINADGSYAWTKGMGSVTGHCLARSLCLASDGSVYATGTFTGEVEFNRTGGSDIIKSSWNGQRTDGFLMKLSSSGGYSWTKAIEVVEPFAVSVDSVDDPYVSGRYTYTTDFDFTAGTDERVGPNDANSSAIFLTKLTAAGAYGWTKTYGIVTPCQYLNLNSANGLFIGSDDTIFLIGGFISELDFGPSYGNTLPVGGLGTKNVFIRRITQ
jgi:hypothetical protein